MTIQQSSIKENWNFRLIFTLIKFVSNEILIPEQLLHMLIVNQNSFCVWKWLLLKFLNCVHLYKTTSCSF